MAVVVLVSLLGLLQLWRGFKDARKAAYAKFDAIKMRTAADGVRKELSMRWARSGSGVRNGI